MIVWIIVLVRTSPIATPSPQNGSPESTTSGSITTSTELGIAVVVRKRPAPKTTTAPIASKPASSVTSTTELGIVNQTRQINDDGSYTFGYETVDGSFRIEKKEANGFVTGKYGYIDGDGRRQEFGNLNYSRFCKSSQLKHARLFDRLCCWAFSWRCEKF